MQYLPNGHVLFTLGSKKYVAELDQNHQEVWTYGVAEGLEHPLSAQRLTNGNTLIGDGKLGRVIEVTPDKRVVWKYETPDIANMRMRNSHRTDAGTTLIAVEAEAKIIEVDKDGKIVWSWQAPNGKNRRAYMGRRLPNGNTLICISDPGELVEVDPSGKVVRSIAGSQIRYKNGMDLGIRGMAERQPADFRLHRPAPDRSGSRG